MMVELVRKADGTFVMSSHGPVVEGCYTIKNTMTLTGAGSSSWLVPQERALGS